MTFLNFTFQDPSPLISYLGQWTEGTGDQFLSKYSGGSFKETNTTNSTATVTFVGTSITIFGAQRFNHGNYTVKLDDGPELVGDGHINDPSNNVFQFPFWNAQNLSNKQHTVILTNVPTVEPFLDIDFISIGRELGPPGYTGPISNVTVDDESPFVMYNPPGAWSASSSSTALNSSLHSTIEENASVSVFFQGSSIELYGLYANAPFQANVDDQPPTHLAGPNVDLSAAQEHPQTLLFLADGLDENKTHVATLVNSVNDLNRAFFFDYAIVRSSQRFSSANTPSPNPNFAMPVSSSPSTKNSTPSSTHIQATPSSSTVRQSITAPGALIGGIVGGVGGIVILAFIGFILFCRLRYHRRKSGRRLDILDSPPYSLSTTFMKSSLPSQPSHVALNFSSSPGLSQEASPLTGETIDDNQQRNSTITQTYILQEQDAGRLIEMRLIPPMYNTEW